MVSQQLNLKKVERTLSNYQYNKERLSEKIENGKYGR
jgi:hypothetical protein